MNIQGTENCVHNRDIISELNAIQTRCKLFHWDHSDIQNKNLHIKQIKFCS